MSRLNVASINGQAVGGTRNFILNPDFELNVEQVAATSDNVAFATSWTTAVNAGTYSFRTEELTGSDREDFPDDIGIKPKAYGRFIITSAPTGASAYVSTIQYIRDVTTLANQEVTLSFWARTADTSKSIGFEAYQFFGTGGSSTVDGIGATSWALTSGDVWTKYSTTFTVDSLSGKTIGTTPDFLVLRFWLSAGTDYDSRSGSLGHQTIDVDVTGVQLELGSQATPREYLPFEMEKARASFTGVAITTGQMADDTFWSQDVASYHGVDSGGLLAFSSFSTYPQFVQKVEQALVSYDLGSSPAVEAFATAGTTNIEVSTSTSTTIGDFTDNKVTIICNNNSFRIANRAGGVRTFKLTFL